MPIEISTPVQLERERMAKQADEANIRLEQLKKAYAESPEMQIERGRAALERLQNDAHHLNRIVGAE